MDPEEIHYDEMTEAELAILGIERPEPEEDWYRPAETMWDDETEEDE